MANPLRESSQQDARLTAATLPYMERARAAIVPSMLGAAQQVQGIQAGYQRIGLNERQMQIAEQRHGLNMAIGDQELVQRAESHAMGMATEQLRQRDYVLKAEAIRMEAESRQVLAAARQAEISAKMLQLNYEEEREKRAAMWDEAESAHKYQNLPPIPVPGMPGQYIRGGIDEAGRPTAERVGEDDKFVQRWLTEQEQERAQAAGTDRASIRKLILGYEQIRTEMKRDKNTDPEDLREIEDQLDYYRAIGRRQDSRTGGGGGQKVEEPQGPSPAAQQISSVLGIDPTSVEEQLPALLQQVDMDTLLRYIEQKPENARKLFQAVEIDLGSNRGAPFVPR